MRVTNLMMVDHAIQSMSDNLDAINRLQNKVSSGKQFQNASDDPVRASVSLSLKSNLRTLDSYTQAADFTNDWLSASDSALGRLEDIAVQATDLIQRGINDSLSASERANSLGSEMQGLLTQAVEIGNTSQNNQYIFSGYQVGQKAFELVDAATPLLDYKGDPFTPKVVNYIGDQGIMQRNVGPDQSVTLNIRGDQALEDFFQNLTAASNALQQNDTSGLQTILGNLKTSLDTMDQYRTANGARLRQVQSASDYLQAVQAQTKSLLSKNEDINIAEGIALLDNQQVTYNAVLEVSQRAISALSLFDYLR